MPEFICVHCKYCAEPIPLAETGPEFSDDFLPEPHSEIIVRHSTHVPSSRCRQSAVYDVDFDIRPIRRLRRVGLRPHPEFYDRNRRHL